MSFYPIRGAVPSMPPMRPVRRRIVSSSSASSVSSARNRRTRRMISSSGGSGCRSTISSRTASTVPYHLSSPTRSRSSSRSDPSQVTGPFSIPSPPPSPTLPSSASSNLLNDLAPAHNATNVPAQLQRYWQVIHHRFLKKYNGRPQNIMQINTPVQV